MKTFVNALSLFLIIGFLLSNSFVFIFPFAQSDHVAGEDIHYIIELSKQKNNSNVLIIGDSVARQLLRDSYIPDCINLTSNQAISMVGQYILVFNALSNNSEIRTIILIYHPRSFRNNLDQRWTFNYFCKPFLNKDNSLHLSRTVNEILYSKPSWLVYIPIVRFSSLLGMLDFSGGIEIPRDSLYISGLSSEYIVKIDELASINNAEFTILAPVISEYYRNSIDMFEEDVACLNLNSYFEYYGNTMLIKNVEMFSDDIHLNSEALAEVQNGFIYTIQPYITNNNN